LSSDFVDKYSDAAIENEAAIPVINPAIAIKRVFCNAKVNPAKVPVNSTLFSVYKLFCLFSNDHDFCYFSDLVF
jgi:hypothetical protein